MLQCHQGDSQVCKLMVLYPWGVQSRGRVTRRVREVREARVREVWAAGLEEKENREVRVLWEGSL